MPTTATSSRLVTAQCGIRVVASTNAVNSRAGTRSNRRCAKRSRAAGRSSPGLEASTWRGRRRAQLTDSPREHRIGQQADRERREDVRERRLLRARHRLADHDVPRDRAHEHRREVQDERDADPAPGDGLEGVADEAPVGAAPPQQQPQGGDPRQDESRTREVTPRDRHAATGTRPSAFS